MNITSTNEIGLNTIVMNTMGVLPIRKGGSVPPSGDIPSGYAQFITADDMVFSASDGEFYVKS